MSTMTGSISKKVQCSPGARVRGERADAEPDEADAPSLRSAGEGLHDVADRSAAVVVGERLPAPARRQILRAVNGVSVGQLQHRRSDPHHLVDGVEAAGLEHDVRRPLRVEGAATPSSPPGPGRIDGAVRERSRPRTRPRPARTRAPRSRSARSEVSGRSPEHARRRPSASAARPSRQAPDRVGAHPARRAAQARRRAQQRRRDEPERILHDRTKQDRRQEHVEESAQGAPERDPEIELRRPRGGRTAGASV